MKAKRFTLVELIVIMTMLMVLTVVLNEVIAASKSDIKNSTCSGNLMTIGKMSALYSSENRQRTLPSTFIYPDNDEVSFLTELFIQNPRSLAENFSCPAMSTDKCFNPSDSDSEYSLSLEYGSYIMNVISSFAGSPQVPTSSQGWAKTTENPLHASRIKKPAETFYIMDALERPDTYTSNYWWSNDMSSLRSWRETDHGILPTTSGSDKRDVGYHHEGAFNVLLGDGHVSRRYISQTEEWVATHK